MPPDGADGASGTRARRSPWVQLLRGFAIRVAALAIFIGIWQVVVWTRWKPQFLLPSPFTVLDVMVHHPGAFASDAGVTVARAALGIGLGLVLGVVIGVVAGVAGPLRSVFRSLVSGLSTLPAIIWIPALLIVVGPSNAVLVFVMVMAATPPIARGVIDGLSKPGGRPAGAAEVVGQTRPPQLRHAVVGALPDALSGTRVGWAACWATLLAGEIILTLPSLGLGGQLVNQRGLNDTVAVYQVMIIIFIIGVLVDGVVFGGATKVLETSRHEDSDIGAAAEG